MIFPVPFEDILKCLPEKSSCNNLDTLEMYQNTNIKDNILNSDPSLLFDQLFVNKPLKNIKKIETSNKLIENDTDHDLIDEHSETQPQHNADYLTLRNIHSYTKIESANLNKNSEKMDNLSQITSNSELHSVDNTKRGLQPAHPTHINKIVMILKRNKAK